MPLRPTRTAVLAIAAVAAVSGTAYAQIGQTTAGGTIAPIGPLDPSKPGFAALGIGPPTIRTVRELPKAKAQKNRTNRRASLAYFAQLSDFQLADEESPARIELFDQRPTGLYSWRPQEALMPYVIDASMRQLSQFTAVSPNRQKGGVRAAMNFALISGDQSDNQQENENQWARDLVEGGKPVDPNSGTSDYTDCAPQDKQKLEDELPDDEALRYTGVQDYTDYEGGNGAPIFYDPDHPSGLFGQWPHYPGLMDRSEKPFIPSGLRRGTAPVPTYMANGNHDGGIQGNVRVDVVAEKLALGCFKPFQSNPSDFVSLGQVFSWTNQGFATPPDPDRRFLDRVELKRIYGAGIQPDDHGFAFVDPAQNASSGFTASYYAFNPRPGLKFISLDTVSEGGSVVGSPSGNIDDPQWQWLLGQLALAKAEKRLVVVFGHHPIRSLVSATPDEAEGTCPGRYPSPTGAYDGPANGAGLKHAVGCDLDPRNSFPIHLGPELATLFNNNENVIAYLAGHSHNNRVLPCASSAGCPKTGRGNWWEITTSAVADWPQQQRLLEVMDNKDGTVSIIGTPVDHAASATVPPPGTPAAGMSADQLAAIGRAFSFNDPQVSLSAAGGVRDRDVELIVKDPRQGKGAGLCAAASPSPAGKKADRISLGTTRTSDRKAYPPASLTKKKTLFDTYCLVGGGTVRIGYPAYNTLLPLSKRERKRVNKRAVLILSTRTTHRIKGLRPGSAERTVKRKLKGVKPIRIGSISWYLKATSKARIVVRVRKKKVVELGLADKRLTASRKSAKRFFVTLGP